ncbi:hypothetical protein Hamer_G016131, partial [Homarus americanus]
STGNVQEQENYASREATGGGPLVGRPGEQDLEQGVHERQDLGGDDSCSSGPKHLYLPSPGGRRGGGGEEDGAAGGRRRGGDGGEGGRRGGGRLTHQVVLHTHLHPLVTSSHNLERNNSSPPSEAHGVSVDLISPGLLTSLLTYLNQQPPEGQLVLAYDDLFSDVMTQVVNPRPLHVTAQVMVLRCDAPSVRQWLQGVPPHRVIFLLLCAQQHVLEIFH